MLLQEWSATLRHKLQTNDTHYIDKHGNQKPIKFPIGYFPGFRVHHVGTETAILYFHKLNITPLNIQPNYDKMDRTKNCHITSIVLHSNKYNIGIHSIYNCPRANINQFFGYQMNENLNIAAGDVGKP